MSSLARALFVLGLVAAPAAQAQTTWIVDSFGRPGFHFLDLPEAIAAIEEGDVLVVRSGSYSSLQTSRSVTILGDSLGLTPPVIGSVTVTAANRFALRNAHVSLGVNLFSTGPSVMSDVTTRMVFAVDSSGVSFNRCSVQGPLTPSLDPVQVVRSDVIFTNCLLTATGSQQSTLVCGDGSNVFVSGGIVWGGPFAANPAVRVEAQGTCTIGHDTTRIESGQPTSGGGGSSPAIVVAAGGTLVLDPRVDLVSNRPDPILSFGTVVSKTVPALIASLGVLDRPGEHAAPAVGAEFRSSEVAQRVAARGIATDLQATAGATAVLFAGRPASPSSWPIEGLWLLLGTQIAVYGRTVDPGEHVRFGVAVPNGVPRGTRVMFQALVTTTGGSELSTPAAVVID